MLASHEFPLNGRRVNFTHEEKMLLLNLVEQNKGWILDKPTDGLPWRKKSEVWDEIAVEFNLQTNEQCKRDVRQLRKCWENMKTRYRRTCIVNGKVPGIQPSNVGQVQSSSEADHHVASCNEDNVNKRMASLMATADERTRSFVELDSGIFGHMYQDLSNDYANTSEKSASSSKLSLGDQATHNSSFSENISRVELTSWKPQLKQSSSPASSQDIVEHETSSDRTAGLLKSEAFQTNDQGITIVNVSSATDLEENIESEIPNVPSSLATASDSFSCNLGGAGRDSNATNVRKRKSVFDSSSHSNILSRFGQHSDAVKHRKPVSIQRPKATPSSTLLGPTRQIGPDTEKVLRVRFFRNRIREQEIRLRMMQQKMRHERERHEALMVLLHNRAAHYEAQADGVRSLSDSFNDDNDLCDDLLFFA